MKLLVLADGEVGEAILKWLILNHASDLSLVAHVGVNNEIAELSKQANIRLVVFNSSQQLFDLVKNDGLEFDLGLCLWWPKIIKEPLLSLPKHGFINTHPSLLPYNRGKHYNFWSIVERAPFGVTLHVVDDGVDTGDIVAQTVIPYTWEDTGKSLYMKAKLAMINLFQEVYPVLRTMDFPRTRQDSNVGSFHRASEIDAASEIFLEKKYSARELLNLLRARTFPGHPACFFSDGNETYEVRVEIGKKRP
jgi:methionyl-tRNA formyltransferase